MNGFPSPALPRLAGFAQSSTKISETEKIWHYQDPPEAGKMHVSVGFSFRQSAGEKWRPQ